MSNPTGKMPAGAPSEERITDSQLSHGSQGVEVVTDPNNPSEYEVVTPGQTLPGFNDPGVTPVTTLNAGSTLTMTFAASGDLAIDATLTANVTLSVVGGSVGQYQKIIAILREGATGGFTITLPTGVKWAGGSAPTPVTTANAVNVYTFSTSDGGVTILGHA